MKTAKQLKDAIDGRIKAIIDHCNYCDGKMERDFIKAFEGGYINDKYQALMEQEFLMGAMDTLVMSDNKTAQVNLSKYADSLVDRLVKHRPQLKHKDTLRIEGMKDAIIYIQDLIKY